MALFRKPKKNIRLRNIEDDEDEDSKKDNGTPPSGIGNSVNKSNKAPKKITPLSFADDEEETEIFQVKKSTFSKKMSKEKKSRKGRNEEGNGDDEKLLKIPVASSGDDIVLVVKKEEEMLAKERKQQNVILNGRAAVVAGKDDVSDEEDEISSKFKFSQPKRSEITIESGKIPDAATIHAARKQRQRARQMNLDVIPLETPSAPKRDKKGSSRLVREEDEDCSEDERINMGTGVEKNDLTARRANYFETIDAHEPTIEPDLGAVPVAGAVCWPIADPINVMLHHAPPPPPPSISVSKDLTAPSYLTDRLRDRLTQLKEVHKSHCDDVVRAEVGLKENSSATLNLETSAPDLANKFRFYQEMRGYVTDMVECLDEKVLGLVKLEENVVKLWADRAAYFAGRRRLDVRDQADEMSKSGVPKWSREEEEARTRRAAEREGRRTRRRRARELRSIAVSHVEGMSTDDEETELETATFQNSIDEVARLGFGLLEDVEDEFGTVNGVASRMELWREYDMTAYKEAYVSLCLPKLIGPIIRFKLLTWNPLQLESTELDSMKWWSRLQLYGLTERESLSALAADPDVLVIPTVIEKAILPKLTQLVKNYWDPLSCSQTQRLVNFVKRYVAELPGMTPASAQIKTLLEAILAKLKHAVDNDVFIPISFVGGENKVSGSVFFQRQFASAVKLLRNMLTFQGLLGAEYIEEVALDSLLNRYLLAALRTCQPCEAISKANMVISTFPRWWFQTETKIPKLEMLTKHLLHLSNQVQPYDTTEKESHELVGNLLKTLRLSCPNVI